MGRTNVMHALIWEQSQGKPWLFATSNEDQLSVHPTLLGAVHSAGQARLVDGCSVSDCPGRRHDHGTVTTAISLPKHRSGGATDRGSHRALEESSPIWSLGLLRHCCLSRLLEASDNTFGIAMRAGAERGYLPNVNMPSDAYLDAGDLAAVP